MAQPQLIQIKLSRFDAQPWGFRLQGGVDFAQALVVQKVNSGSLAEKAGLLPGDAVIRINDVDVFNLRHKDAQDIVVRSGNNFVLTIQRGGSTWRPQVTPTGNLPQPQHNSPYLKTVTKTSLAHKQQESSHIGCGHNSAARPFANGDDGNIKSIVNKQYNTPVGIYSDESIAETLSAQAEVLAGGVLGVNFKKNEKEYQPDKSEVLKFLREEENGQSSPEPPCPANFYWTQSHAIGGNERRTPLSHQHQQQEQPLVEQSLTILQQSTLTNVAQPVKVESEEVAPDAEATDPRTIIMPVCPALQGPEYKAEMEAIESALQNEDGPRPLSSSGHATCSLCGVGIVGVFVRIKDKNLHVECFKCATCGTSLKNQGYYNYNNKLYCEIHAKLAALQSPPAGSEGYVPVPIKPNTKLSAHTITSALNSHGYSNIPVANGGSAEPTSAPLNQDYARPFGASSGPTASALKSPVAYPPQRPAVNSYATLPLNNIGQQEGDESLLPQYVEACNSSIPDGADFFEEDHDLADSNRRNRKNFSWPPPKEDSPVVPTAAPLYVPPPETQRVIAKITKGSELEKEEQVTKYKYREKLPLNEQSKSASQLTVELKPPEIESSTESLTSNSTTTTTTSENYQRMYASQVQTYQSQQMYEQPSGSELDYQVDLEVATMQQNLQEAYYMSSSEYISGRRSAQECVDCLVDPLDTYKLMDMVREVIPSPVPPFGGQGSKHVVFVNQPDTKEILGSDFMDTVAHQKSCNNDNGFVSNSFTIETNSSSENNKIQTKGTSQESTQKSKCFIKSEYGETLPSQRFFQPTPEIKIEIAPVRPIPPTKIPNPVPKEWINPMVSVLTTAPDTPFHLVECPCPKPCDCEFECRESNKKLEKTGNKQESLELDKQEKVTILKETSEGSRFAKAITTAPELEVRFQPSLSEVIPLPDETTPYMPPPIDMKPYMREDYRPKSPLLNALTTAPERPFEGHFERDVPIHMLDLPTPKEHLTLSDALRTAPERAYTPLNPENATHTYEKQETEKGGKKYEFQVLNKEKELGITTLSSDSVEYYTTEKRTNSQQRKSSAFAAMQAFQPTQEPLPTNTPRQCNAFYSNEESDPEYERYNKAKERNKKRIDYYQKKEQLLQKNEGQLKKPEISETNTCLTSSLESYSKQNSSSESSSVIQLNATTSKTNAPTSSRNVIYDHKVDLCEVIEEATEELEHSEVLFPPPSPLSHLRNKPVSSGLHKADTIPKYQRNWTILPTQSPIRTPEPAELRENVPLAFVDAPADRSMINPMHKPVARISTTTAVSNQQQQNKNICALQTLKRNTNPSYNETKNQPTQVQFKNEEKSTPQVTMAFQSLDEHLQTDELQTLNRPYTPSQSTKPVPVIPFYQTPEALCFDECPATHARPYDIRTASPFPDRARSPAPGPPPNPLAAIRSSQPKGNELSSLSPRVLRVGSIISGQSYLGASHQQQQNQAQILSQYEPSSNIGRHNYTEVVEERQIDDYTAQRREMEIQKADQQETNLEERKKQSERKMQVSDTQIESNGHITEEYEHTENARAMEIRIGTKTITANPITSETERRQSFGRTGYVANQANRLSGLEQEITNLTSQSQAISARAATLTDTSFPQMSSQEPVTKFPTKPLFSPHDEPERPSYVFSATPYNKMVGPPPGYKKPEVLEQQQQQKQQHQHQKQCSTAYGASIASQQQKSFSTYSSSNFTTSTRTAPSLSSQVYATNDGNLTNAYITNNNKADSASDTTTGASGICPVTGTFCRPGHTCCRQQQLQPQSTATVANNYNQNNKIKYRPNASIGITDTKTYVNATAIATTANLTDTSTSASVSGFSATAPAVATTAQTTFPPSKIIGSDKSNGDFGGSTGATGKGAFGATSAPKRGRGTFNKAVAPGVRVPLCSSCNIQIRGPFITALGRIWCPEHFICVNANCRRPLQDIGFVEEKGDLYCEYCFEKYLAPTCSKCSGKIKGDCLNAIGKQFHPECFTCGHCGKLFGNTPFFLEDGNAYCEADWNELFTTKCFACGFPVEAGDRWVEALNHNYHSQCFNCTYCKQNLEGQSFYNKGGRPFCKNHAR